MTDFETPDRLKTVTEIELLLNTSNVAGGVTGDKMNVKLWSGAQDTILEQAYETNVDVTAPPPYFAEFREEGRFFAIECALDTTKRQNFGGAFASFRPRGRPR